MSFSFESQDVPSSTDFSCSCGDLESPEHYHEFIDKFYFKGHELQIDEHLDSDNKSSEICLFEN